jgi:Fe-S-cluster containining protein
VSGDSEHVRVALVDSWLFAVARENVAAELEMIYASASAAIAERGPACWASGRCCNFDAAGHRLYTTGLEMAYCVVRLAGSAWAAAGERARQSGTDAGVEVRIRGRIAAIGPSPSSRGLLADLAAARARGGCPFQVGNLCGVHEIKPLGCRVYFCDRSAQQWQQDLSERLLADIRSLHDRHAIDYRYGEWREMLGMLAR